MTRTSAFELEKMPMRQRLGMPGLAQWGAVLGDDAEDSQRCVADPVHTREMRLEGRRSLDDEKFSAGRAEDHMAGQLSGNAQPRLAAALTK
jgi:hypothetical protein